MNGKRIMRVTQPLKIAGRGMPVIAMVFEGVEIRDGYIEDGGTFGHNAQKQTVGAAYSIAGGIVGAKYGAIAGAKIGLWFKGVGAVPGAIIGGFFGGVLGGTYGEEWAEDFFDFSSKKTNVNGK